MFKFKRKNKKGFTLTELLVVVLVISVLTAISIPSYKRAVERTRAMQGVVTLQNIAKAQNVYNAKRGSYATNMHALPLDMKDLRGEDVVGDTFEDRFFGYTVYGDILSQSYAKRSDGGYELAIDYDTGKLYCTPADNETCKMLGFDVNTKEIPTTDTESKLACDDEVCYLYDGDKIIGKCEFRAGYLDTCQSTDTNGFMCIADECGEFRNGALLEGTYCKKEDLNKDGTACAKYTFECDKEKGLCYTYKDGEEIKSCPINETGTMCKPEVLTGWVCKDGEDLCLFYDEDGKEMNKCVANAEHTACLKDGEIVCRGDGYCTLSNFGTCIANKANTDCETGLICAYDGGWVCREFDNGKEVKTCFANEDRTGCLEEGKLVCRDGKCIDSKGNLCESNKEGTACAEKPAEEVKDGLICEGDKCTYYKDGKEMGTCDATDMKNCYEIFGLSGVVCNSDKTECHTIENGKVVLQCSGGKCIDSKGNWCEANADGTACKTATENVGSYACGGDKCVVYDKDGNEIKSCYMDDVDCFKEFAIEGTLCNKDGTCLTYGKDGALSAKCWKTEDGSAYCEDYVNNKYNCESNSSMSGCKEETSNTSGKWSCDGSKCSLYDEDGKEIKTCEVGTGETDCFEQNGASGTVCTTDGSTCYQYENGKNIMKCDKTAGICYDYVNNKECTANASNTGCAEESGSSDHKDGTFCTKDQCKTYKDGQLISYCKYWDGGSECYNAKTGKECTPNEDNTRCAEESGSSSGGKTFKCDDAGMCTFYDENGKEIGNCSGDPVGSYADDCIKNNGGSGFYCYGSDKDKACKVYEDGKLVIKCRSSDGTCDTPNGTCQANETLTGCKEDSTSTEPENPKNGTVCYKEEDGKRCYTYKDGKLVDSCNANKTMDGCTPTDQDEELVCYKDFGVCYDFTTDGKIIGQCPINTAGTDCASSETDKMTNGLLCDKDKCYTYKDGKVVGTCEANNTATGCKDETGSTSGDLKCSGDTCTDADGNTCYGNGYGVCIQGKGEEFACYKDKGRCITYKDGKPMDECDINESGTGCKATAAPEAALEAEPAAQPANGLICEDWECKEYKDGEAVSSCYSNGEGGCIEGKGEEFVCYPDKGVCRTYKDGKTIKDCPINETGGGCKDESSTGSTSGELTCDSGPGSQCFYKDADGKEQKCFNNGNGECIKGKGTEVACFGEQCTVYVDGKKTRQCDANEAGDGCKDESSSGGISVPDKGYGVVCQDDVCYEYYDGGKLSGKTFKYNADGDCESFDENGKYTGNASVEYCKGFKD